MTEAKEKLAGKFASENHAGPKDVVDFLDLDDEESDNADRFVRFIHKRESGTINSADCSAPADMDSL